jgi:hypothetical protein
MCFVLLLSIALQTKVEAALPPEIQARLEATRRTLADERRPLDQRASLALDEAAALDRESQACRDPGARRRRVALAIVLLDEFNAAHPKHELCTPLALQAAVYVWADGRRDLDAWRLNPSDAAMKAYALARLVHAVDRLDRLEPEMSGADPLVAQNARFRLAQALADLAWLEPPEKGRDRLKRAMVALDPTPTEEAVAGYARLLRGEVLGRLGELDKAEEELEAAAAMKSPAPPEALTEAKVTVLRERHRYNQAIKVIEESTLDPIARSGLAVSVRLAERTNGRSVQDRDDAEVDALARARTLRGSSRPEARLALNELARTIDRPSRRADPEDWEILADGALGLGDWKRASRLAEAGGDRATSLGYPDESARLRFRAAGMLFQADDYRGADALLGRIVADAKGGALRAKAGMLRALARGRALRTRQAWIGRDGYGQALRDQLRDFPDDPASNEARWLMGELEGEDGRAEPAIALWKAIPPGHARWLAARLAIAEENQRAIDETRDGESSGVVRARFRDAAAFLRESIRLATDSTQVLDLDLASARLDLTPGLGRVELASSLTDRLTRQSGTPEQRARARTLQIVALSMTHRYAEAEAAIAADASRLPVDDLLLAARLLDRAAADLAADAGPGRLGRLARLVAEAVARRGEGQSPRFQNELKLRLIRAALLANDVASARRDLRRPPDFDPTLLDAGSLRDLSDAFLRLEAYGLAVDVERFRGRSLKPGSLDWLESRYTLALALYSDGKADRARPILDAAAILHPDLGGGRLKEKIESLRQRLEEDR